MSLEVSISSSLINAGFSEQEAGAVIPSGLRVEGQVLNLTINSSDNLGVVLESDTSIQNSDNKNSIDVLEVPVSVGVTFNGLSNWNTFQDNRFNQER